MQPRVVTDTQLLTAERRRTGELSDVEELAGYMCLRQVRLL